MVPRPRVRRSLLPLLGLALLVVVGWWYSPAEFLGSVERGHRHWTVVAVAVAGLYLVRPFFLWPLSVFSVFVGYLVGFPLGVAPVLLGTLITCLPPFLLADYVRDDTPYGERVAAAGETFVDATGELRSVVATRLSPAPADAVSYGAGVAGVSTGAFAVGTLVGELPWAVFYVLLGESLRTFSAAAIGGVDVRLLLGAAGVALVLVGRPLYEFLSGTVRREETGS